MWTSWRQWFVIKRKRSGANGQPMNNSICLNYGTASEECGVDTGEKWLVSVTVLRRTCSLPSPSFAADASGPFLSRRILVAWSPYEKWLYYGKSQAAKIARGRVKALIYHHPIIVLRRRRALSVHSSTLDKEVGSTPRGLWKAADRWTPPVSRNKSEAG